MAGRSNSRPSLEKADWAAEVSIWIGGKIGSLSILRRYIMIELLIFGGQYENLQTKECVFALISFLKSAKAYLNVINSLFSEKTIGC